MLADERLDLSRKPIDSSWRVEGYVPYLPNGFCPFNNMIPFCGLSEFAEWLATPERSGRDFNCQDALVKQALYHVHDYIHIWSTHAIRYLRPELVSATKSSTQIISKSMYFASC